MVGLAGFFEFKNTHGRLSKDDVLSRLNRARALPGIQYNVEVCSSPRFVATNALPATHEEATIHDMQPLDGRYFVLLHGEVRNLSEIKKASAPSLKSDNDGAILMAHFALKGVSFVEDLRGPFSILIFDRLNNELFLFNDQFGSRPIYFYEEKGIIYFGSEKKFILSLIKDRVELDPVGLLQVFAHQHNIGTRTFIHNLGSLPAYSMLRVSGSGFTVSSIKHLGFSSSKPMSFKEGVLTWSDLLRNSVTKCLQGKKRVALQLSGGFDSRAVACAIPRDFRPFTSITRMAHNPLDAQYAEEVAKCLGFQHYSLPSTYVPSDYIPAIVWRTECSISYHHCRSIEDFKFTKKLAGYYMGGQFGDSITGAPIAKFVHDHVDSILFPERMYQRYTLNRELLRFIFVDNFLNEYLPQIKECFINSFKGITEKGNPQTFQVWDQQQRQTNFTLRAGLVQRHIMEGIYPFLDVDYSNFVTSVPQKWWKDQLMYRAVIHHLGPEVRRVPNANNGHRVHGSLLANQIEHWAATKKERLLKRMGAQSKSGNVVHLFSNDESSVSLIRAFLKSRYFDPTIFNSSGIEELLKGDYWMSPAHDKMLRTLATFAVGLPLFVYNPVTECPEAALPHLALS